MAKYHLIYKAGDGVTGWTVPAGTTSIEVVIGAGGGSGWTPWTASGNLPRSYGGGGGGVAERPRVLEEDRCCMTTATTHRPTPLARCTAVAGVE